MAHYLLRMSAVDWVDRIIEADSAIQAIIDQDLTEGTVEVWTLRSGEPRVFQVSTESVRTVKLV